MNILIIGACNKIGKKIIAHALRKGHRITAIVEKTDSLKLYDDNLRQIYTKSLTPEQTIGILENQNIVMNVICDKKIRFFKKNKKSLSMPIDDILPVMINQTVVKRLLIINTKVFGRHKTTKKCCDLVKNSDLSWTIVNPATLIDKPKTGCYKVGQKLSKNPFVRISHSDVADYIINNLENNALIGKAIFIRH